MEHRWNTFWKLGDGAEYVLSKFALWGVAGIPVGHDDTEGPEQAREMGWQEAHEGQQQEVQSSVLGVAKLCAPVYAGAT